MQQNLFFSFAAMHMYPVTKINTGYFSTNVVLLQLILISVGWTAHIMSEYCCIHVCLMFCLLQMQIHC